METRESWKLIAALLLATTALLLSFVAVFAAARPAGPAPSGPAPAGPAPAGPAPAGPAPAGPAGAAVTTKRVTVELVEMAVRPGTLDVAPGTRLVVTVVNKGELRHDLKLGGTRGTRLLAPGQRQTVSFGVLTRTTEAWCTVPGHRAAGMVLHLRVTGAASGESAGPAGSASQQDHAGAANQAPGPGWRPYDPALRPVAGAREHRLTVRAVDDVLEVAPGVRQRLWTFNGTVPGPVLRGRVGDVFTVTFVNAGTIGHSIDFHASEVAPNRLMRTIDPGQSLVYQFRAQRAGVWMYHCGTAPVLHHIGNGMYGALIVDPPDLARVDRELVFVQSEFYLGPPGEVGDLAKMRRAAPDLVVFNGYASQYTHRPIHVRARERLRIWVLDAGPNNSSAFHVIGSQFETVYAEGTYRLRGGPGGAQVLDLAPAQGGFVELTLDEPGRYPFVTHRFADADLGANGVLEAVR